MGSEMCIRDSPSQAGYPTGPAAGAVDVEGPCRRRRCDANVTKTIDGHRLRRRSGVVGLWALSTKLATAIDAVCSLPVAALLGFNPSRGQHGSTALGA